MAVLMVLGGGGALGAYQAGCLVALAEAGVLPDRLFGCSAGALNSVVLAQGPSLERTHQLANWWRADASRALLAPSRGAQVRSLVASARNGGASLMDSRALREMIAAAVSCHDVSELAVPVSITTTCLDCAEARHHTTGPVVETLLASWQLTGLLPAVTLPDGHQHVDGGIVCGVPLDAAMAVAGPEDTVLVLDCGLAPVTRGTDCSAGSGDGPAGCALPALEPRPYVAPQDKAPRGLDTVLRAFTAARNVASTVTVRPWLSDPRVRVLPHVADAYSAGLLATIPSGTRDASHAGELVNAGRDTTQRWLAQLPMSRSTSYPGSVSDGTTLPA
jgi:predicted acylesterase/phospholipase RssA